MHVAIATFSALPPEFADDERLAAALGAGEVDGGLVLGAEGRNVDGSAGTEATSRHRTRRRRRPLRSPQRSPRAQPCSADATTPPAAGIGGAARKRPLTIFPVKA
jgi:hypothetical protein